MSQENRVSRSEGIMSVSLDQAINNILFTLDVYKPIQIYRFGVLSDSAQGLLAPMRLKLRKSTAFESANVDIPNSTLIGEIRSRGEGITKEIVQRFIPGDRVAVAVETPPGGLSTGDIFIEYWELPFSGEVVSNFTKSA